MGRWPMAFVGSTTRVSSPRWAWTWRPRRRGTLPLPRRSTPGSSLRVALDGYLTTLNQVPAVVKTEAQFIATAALAALTAYRRAELDLPQDLLTPTVPGRAGGGPVLPNSVYTVGEHGRETLV